MEQLTWQRYWINLIPSKRLAQVFLQTWNTKDSPFYRKFPLNKRKNRREKLIEEIPIDPIPMEEYVSTTQHFDSTALQSDDRFFTTKTIGRRPNQKEMIKVKAKIARKYPSEPKLINV